MPDPSPSETLSGRQVQVQTCRVNLLPTFLVPELHRDIGLVRTLVLREPNIPVDPEEGTMEGLRVSDKVGANRSEPGGDILDEPEARLKQLFLVLYFVSSKPCPIVVFLKVFEELEELWREVRCHFLLAQLGFTRFSIELHHIGSTRLLMRGVQLRSSDTT